MIYVGPFLAAGTVFLMAFGEHVSKWLIDRKEQR